MLTVVLGAVILIITSALFWYCLPRDGRTHRFVDTELEPYVGVAFCSGIALGFTMVLSGILDVIG